MIAVLNPFPVRLPTFCFAISVSQRSSIFIPKIVYRIYLPGDPDDASSDEASIVAEIDENNPGGMIEHSDAMADVMGLPDKHRKFVCLHANMAFRDLKIKEPGSIKVRADIGEIRYRLGSIGVLQAPNPATEKKS